MFAQQQQPLASRHCWQTCVPHMLLGEGEEAGGRKAVSAWGSSGPPVALQGLSLTVGRNPDAESQLASALFWRLHRSFCGGKEVTEPLAVHLVLQWGAGKDAAVLQIEI